MCTGGSAPKQAAALPEAPVTPLPDDTVSTGNRDKRRQAQAGQTLLTGSGGVQNSGANVQRKQLLGQ